MDRRLLVLSSFLVAACGELATSGSGTNDAGSEDGGASSGGTSSGSGSSSGASGGSSSGSSSGGVPDATVGVDGSTVPDGSSPTDGAAALDSAPVADGATEDSSVLDDGSSSEDAASTDDTGAPVDAAPLTDGSFSAPVAVIQHVLVPPVLLASDGTDLFWIDGNGLLWTAPTGGGTPKTLSSTCTTELLSMTATSLYVVNSSGQTIDEVSKTSGSESPVITTTGNFIAAASVLGSRAYWIEEGKSDTSPVQTASLTGGATTLLDTFPIPVSPQSVTLAATPDAIFIDFGDSLNMLPPGGGTTSQGLGLASQTILPWGDSVYAATTGLVLVAANGTTTTSIATETNNVSSIAIDDAYVYWVNNAPSGSVVAAPKQGGQNYIIAYDANPSALAVDDAAVYWGDIAGNIQRAAKQ
jgi:hypothetical protein